MKKIFVSLCLLTSLTNFLVKSLMSNSLKKDNSYNAKAKQTNHNPQFILTIGDMMMLPVDCIVNPANSYIQGGGGVDGIITENRKPQDGQYNPPVGDTSNQILKELKILKDKHPEPINANGLLPEGQAIITSSGTIINQNTKTIRFVIATVGPQGQATQAKDISLHNAYYNSLLLAANIHNKATTLLNIINSDLSLTYQANPIRSVAFPSISTGLFGYEFDHAAPMAISGIIKAMQKHPDAFDVVHLVIHPSTLQNSPYLKYANEMRLPKYTKMLENTNTSSPITLAIQKENGEKEIVYSPN